ncbi:GNAT family N-acetyltransferase [bacterium]|nr:GNAT family N-acetyltransferase [bacterium]
MSFDLQPILAGDLLVLRPLEAEDYQALFAVASDPLIWEQHPASNRYEESVFQTLFEQSLASGGALVATLKETNEVIGSSRYHAYNVAASEIEIGWTFLARKYWGGIYNGEMKRLMLSHAFRFVDSVVLLVGPDNIRSQRAVEKIGGKRDGVRTDGTGLTSYLYRIKRADVAT